MSLLREVQAEKTAVVFQIESEHCYKVARFFASAPSCKEWKVIMYQERAAKHAARARLLMGVV